MPRPRHTIDIFNDLRAFTSAIINYWPAARPQDGYFGLNVFMSACFDALSDTISDEVVESIVSRSVLPALTRAAGHASQTTLRACNAQHGVACVDPNVVTVFGTSLWVW